MNLTDRQQAVLDALVQHWAEHGYSPTVRQLADRLGLHSHRTVVRILGILRERGLVEGSARALKVTASRDPEALPVEASRGRDSDSNAARSS